MAEKKTLIDGRKLKYSGLINIRELLEKINDWLLAHGYEKEMRKTYEDVFEEGKETTIELAPFKIPAPYMRYRIRMYMTFRDLKEVCVEKGNLKTQMMKGDVNMVFDTYLEADQENHWEGKPLFYFLRMIIDKYVYRINNKQFEKEAVRDALELEDHIKSYLNLQRYI